MTPTFGCVSASRVTLRGLTRPTVAANVELATEFAQTEALMEAKAFVNYYEILEVSPSASTEAIEHRFRSLARQYHPDNKDTGNRSRFDAIVEAHETLKDATKRAQYHENNERHLPPLSESAAADGGRPELNDGADADHGEIFVDGLGIERDISIQNNLLMMLYLQRRRNIKEPGIGNAELERLSGSPPEHLEFHIWYLKAKGWICTGESGLFEITIDGVDRASLIYRESAQKRITDQS
jgi:hypothetical protein